jgi:DNA polymerase-3 subunit alpha
VPELKEEELWDERTRLQEEKAVLGFYVSSHPLAKLKKFLAEDSYTTASLSEANEGEEIALAGVITEVKRTTTRNGDPMVYLVLEDLEGHAEGLVFSKELTHCEKLLKKDETVLVRGRVIFRNGRPSLKVSEIGELNTSRGPSSAAPQNSTTLQEDVAVISVDSSEHEDRTLMRLRDILSIHPGHCPVFLEIIENEGRRKTRIKVNKRFFITVDKNLQLAIEDLLGPGRLKLLIRPHSPSVSR